MLELIGNLDREHLNEEAGDLDAHLYAEEPSKFPGFSHGELCTFRSVVKSRSLRPRRSVAHRLFSQEGRPTSSSSSHQAASPEQVNRRPFREIRLNDLSFI